DPTPRTITNRPRSFSGSSINKSYLSSRRPSLLAMITASSQSARYIPANSNMHGFVRGHQRKGSSSSVMTDVSDAPTEVVGDGFGVGRSMTTVPATGAVWKTLAPRMNSIGWRRGSVSGPANTPPPSTRISHHRRSYSIGSVSSDATEADNDDGFVSRAKTVPGRPSLSSQRGSERDDVNDTDSDAGVDYDTWVQQFKAKVLARSATTAGVITEASVRDEDEEEEEE
ncbi:hypothetical protein HK102_003192, partial [Quaeritorhiza haematococci]